jgi:hypothetical protein
LREESSVESNLPRRDLESGPLSRMEPALVRAMKTGRNDPCPCGSGKKFKKCCGA